MNKTMGLDIGDRKIGVALSDPSQVLATPLKTIIRIDDDSAIKEILSLTVMYNVSKIVVGLPYSLSGAIGKQAEKVLSFAEQITQATSINIIMQDERLSSVSADQKLREAGKKGTKLKKGIDAAAATVILQSYLDEAKMNESVSQIEQPNV
jgi:putative Holliday junction resolvase